jgi:CheY-like chemotaxis protein
MTDPRPLNQRPGVTENDQLSGYAGKSATGRRPGILVVDDQKYMRDMLAIALRQRGFSVWLASDGWEALDLYQDHCKFVDMILMDVRMPGLDGLRTLRELRQVDPDVRCCFMSGDLGGHDERALRAIGASAVFHKPVHLDDLFLMLSKLDVRTGATPANGR